MNEDVERTIISVEPDDPEDLGDLEDLLLSIRGGLKPQNFSEEEVQLLEEEVGENWFEEMGFDVFEEYEEPTF